MTAKHHRLYLDSTIALARTLVVKSEYSAEQINNEVALRFGTNAVNTLDKTTWKYYLNVSGEYHPTDTVIKVKSLDTMQEIEFTKANLVINTATARGYMPGTRYYRELVTKYPNHRLLIHGILFPADIQAAIEAADFSVLSYPADLVEPNEEDLIPNINLWLQTQRKRWYVNEFNITDELYGASFLLVMFQQLVPLILTLRRKACKTFQAHSYHVRQYLISHGLLEAYIDQMTAKQRMFFYRNIRYIHRHAGKEDTFQWLTQNVLTERGMPLAQYDAYHRTTDMPENLIPAVRFKARALTSVSSAIKEDTDVAGILSKEVPLAPGNADESVYSRASIQEAFTYTETATHPTKVLESSSIQESTGSARNIQEAALNLWAYAAATGRYNSYVFVTDPNSGAELSMPALVAFHYFAYAFYKAHKLSLDVVPPIVATQVPKWPGTSLPDLLKLVDTKDIDESVVFGIWNNHPLQRTFPNTDSFFDSVQELADAQNTQLLYTGIPETFMGRGMARAVYEALYPTYVYENSTTGTPIKEYFAPYELVLDGLDEAQWQQLYLNLFAAATGQSLTSVQAKSQMQETMVKIMARLSSYSIQFVSDITASEMQSVDWQSMRFGPGVNSGRLYYWLLLTSLDAINPKVTATPRYQIELPAMFNRFSMKVPKQVTETIEVGFDIQGFVNVTLNAESVLSFDGVRMLYDQTPRDDLIERWEDLPGMDAWDGYAQDQLAAMPDVYSHVCRTYPLVPTKVDLSDKFNSFNLPIFKALEVRNTHLRAYQGYAVSGLLRYFRNEVFVVMLDGFESNLGDLNIDALQPVFGHNLLNTFTYIPFFDLDDAKQFYYTGGNYKLGTIRPGASSTDMVGPVLTGTNPDLNVEFQGNPTPGAVMLNFSQVYPVMSLSFSQFPAVIDMALTSGAKMISLSLFTATAPQMALTFGQAVKNLLLPTFSSLIRTFAAPVLMNAAKAYVIPIFKQNFVAQGPVLISYGIKIIDVTTQANPDLLADPDLGVEFTSTTKTIDGPDLELVNNVKTIDIPNFEDLFNEPD